MTLYSGQRTRWPLLVHSLMNKRSSKEGKQAIDLPSNSTFHGNHRKDVPISNGNRTVPP